ncbi:LysR family transcriptional regulator [Kordiimonas sediminis]|uniref:LysR family transcriptional regulator n=1 Tax=Kordiimonas sediminis TaxID=1735581 RepID=A0A919E7Q7_9PROT|nr:LysR family transcriptional regulator [Kordiimonas sediminis]GHF26952.1 LysR family transcriptional regulator [Kordiimonas sediminis]
MIDLYLIRYFVAVVESGTFTRAAEKAFVSQPTLSAGIKKLEEQVGKPLFERSNKRVFLTEAGTRFLPRAKAILHECNLAMLAVKDSKGPAVLRLGLLRTLPNRRIGEMLSEFRRLQPDLAFEIQDGTEQELMNRLEDRSIDFALSIYRGEKAETAVPLYCEPYLMVLAKDHPLAGRKQLAASDLVNEYMIVRSRCEILSETSRYFTDRNIRPRFSCRTSNDARALAMVAAGLGATVVPESLVDERLTALPLSEFQYERTIGLFLPKYEQTDELGHLGSLFQNHVISSWKKSKENRRT